MKLEQQQFLVLLRAGLWDTTVDTVFFSQATDWKGIALLAHRQTVKGIIAEAINKLPVAHQPPPQLMRELAFSVSRTRVCHARQNAVLAELIHLFRQKGINPVLLKGQGMAINYPDPTLRHCGDIDLYIGEEDFKKSILLAQQWKTDKGDSMLIAKHYGFDYKGVTVELHRVAGLSYIPWRNNYLQQWTKKHLCGQCLRVTAINKDVEILLPPYLFDVVFILEHAWHHFVFLGGISLRQICDWGMYLHRYHSKINRVELEADLKRLGLWKGWKLFGYIAVNFLGLPQSELPFYDEYVKDEADMVIRQILEEGYGKDRVSLLMAGYMGRKLKALQDVFGRRRTICRYEGIFNTTVYLACFLGHGIYRMLRYWRNEE